MPTPRKKFTGQSTLNAGYHNFNWALVFNENGSFSDEFLALLDALSATFAGLTVSDLTASLPVFTNASKRLVSNAMTGTGNVVMSASPTLTGTITAAIANFSGNVGVTGRLGVGGASTTGSALNLRDISGLTSGTAQNGMSVQSIFGVGATSSMNGVNVLFTADVGTYTTTTVRGILVQPYVAAAGQTVTTAVGLDIQAVAAGATNLAIRTGATGAVEIGNLTASNAVLTDANKRLVSQAMTGSGDIVRATSPTLVTPNLGVASATSISLGGGAAFTYEEGTFTLTLSGFTASVTGTARYTRVGKNVTLYIPAATGTSNDTAMQGSGIPASIQPARMQVCILAEIQDSAGLFLGAAAVNTDGTVDFSIKKTSEATGFSSTGFTNSGTKGFAVAMTISYNLN